MECEFCRGIPKRAEYVGDGIKTMGMMTEMMFGINENAHSNYIYIKNGNLLVWDNSAGEYAELSAEIKYCPMCGRKLQSNTTESLTCSFSDCDNFKNPDYERCIECKRKQKEKQTERSEP